MKADINENTYWCGVWGTPLKKEAYSREKKSKLTSYYVLLGTIKDVDRIVYI